MAKREQLRVLRLGTVINATSKWQEKDIGVAVREAISEIHVDDLRIDWRKQIHLANVIADLRRKGYEFIEFAEPLATSHCSPMAVLLACWMKMVTPILFLLLR